MEMLGIFLFLMMNPFILLSHLPLIGTLSNIMIILAKWAIFKITRLFFARLKKYGNIYIVYSFPGEGWFVL